MKEKEVSYLRYVPVLAREATNATLAAMSSQLKLF